MAVDQDDLLLAVCDREIAITVDELGTVSSDEPWQDVLRRIAERAWEGVSRNPTVIALTFARTTGGPGERRMVELILSTFARAGLSRAQTVLYYRAFADAVLALRGQNAVLATLDPEVQEKDATAWSRIYAQLGADEYPTARAHIAELIDVKDRTIYFAVVEAIISAAERAGATADPG